MGLPDNLQGIIAAAPTTVDHPQVATALAQGNATPEQAQAVAMGTWAANAQKQMQTMNGDDRKGLWRTYSTAEQQMLLAVGVPDPTASSNWFQRAVSDVGSAVSTAWDKSGADSIWHDVAPVRNAIASDYGTSIHATMQGAGFLQHVFGSAANAALQEEENSGQSDVFSGFAKGIYNGGVSGYARAYRDAWDHKDVLSQRELARIQQNYDPATFALAKLVATGTSPNDIIAQLPDQQQQAKVNSIFNSDNFTQALQQLNGAKVSYGRVIAQDLGLDPAKHHTAFSAVSGVIDGVETVLTDPTLALGKIDRAYRAARYGVKVVGDDSALFRQALTAKIGNSAHGIEGDKNVVRYYQGVLDRVNRATKPVQSEADQRTAQSAMTELQRVNKQTEPLNNEVLSRARHIWATQQRPMTMDDLREHLLENAGVRRVLIGSPYDHVPMLAHDNVIQGALRNTWAKTDVISRLQRGLEDKAVAVPGGGASTLGDVQDGAALRDFRWDNRQTQGRPNGTLPQQAGQAFLAARRGLSPDALQQRLALALTRATTPVVMGHTLDLSDAQSISHVHDLAQTFAPRFYAGKITAAYANADIAGRRQIVKGLMATLFEAAGVRGDADAERWARQYLSSLDNTSFSATGVSQLNGVENAIGFGETKVHVVLPDFKTMYGFSQHNGIAGRILGQSVFQGAKTDAFMNKIWRPGVLGRPALSVRNAGEEQVNYALRNGILNYVKGRAIARDLVPDEFGSVLHVIGRGLTLPLKGTAKRDQVVGDIDNVGKLATAFSTDKIRRAGLKLSDGEYAALKEVFEKSPVHRQLFLDEVKNASNGLASDGRAVMIERAKTRGGNAIPMHAVGTGEWKQVSTDSPEGALRWAGRVQHMANDGLYSIGMAHIRDRNAAVDAMERAILAPENEWYRKGNVLSQNVGARGVAERAYQELAHTFSDPSGTLLDDIVNKVVPKPGALDKEAITHDLFDSIDDSNRPTSVVGQDTINIVDPNGFMQDLINKGFNILDDATSYLSKQPIYFANLAKAAKDMMVYRNMLREQLGQGQSGKALQNAYDEADRAWLMAAHESAVDKTLEFVDNPLKRSQMSVVVRNLVPFWRAQEEFYRRWVGTFFKHPLEGAARIEKLGLALHAMHASGFTHTDDQGNEYFTYPATSAARGTMNALAKAFPGLGLSTAVIPLELTGQLKMLNQGANPSSLRPSAGPLITVPLSVWNMLWPSGASRGVQSALLGDYAATNSLTDALVPTPFRRFEQATTDSSAVQSTRLSAMQAMHVAGLDPADDATDTEKQAYLDRVGKWAKEFQFLRAVFGLFVPASPQMGDLAPKTSEAYQEHGVYSLHEDYTDLVTKMGIEQGSIAYMAANPDGTFFTQSPDGKQDVTYYGPSAYAVGKTKSPSGASLSADKAVDEFMQSNKSFVKANPNAAAFWLPLQGGNFDQQTWNDQLATSLRLKRTPGEFYDALKLKDTMKVYYDTKDLVDNAIAQQGGASSYGGKQLTENWKAWRTNFLALHPVMASELASYGTREFEREQTFAGVQHAIETGHAPAGPVTDQLKAMIDLVTRYQAQKAQVPGRTNYEENLKKTLTNSLQNGLLQIASQSQNAQMFYDRILRPMFNLTTVNVNGG